MSESERRDAQVTAECADDEARRANLRLRGWARRTGRTGLAMHASDRELTRLFPDLFG